MRVGYVGVSWACQFLALISLTNPNNKRVVLIRLNWLFCKGKQIKAHMEVAASALAAVLIAAAVTLPQVHGQTTITHNGNSVDIDFVDIGNAGNVADTTGYGAVGYDYSIGTYEVTAVQYAIVRIFDNLIGNNSGSWSGRQPAGGVSWYEAAKFANWLTTGDALQGAYLFSNPDVFTGVNRELALATFGTIYLLPSEDEWYKAAYFKSDGSGYTEYTTGDSKPLARNQVNYDDVNVSPWNVGGGSVENNGTYDMAGNVFEWNEGAFSGGDPTDDEQRVIRGGGWTSSHVWLRSSYNLRPSTRAGSEVGFLGFRVASVSSSVVPEPSSVGLLVTGAMGCVMRRKRG